MEQRDTPDSGETSARVETGNAPRDETESARPKQRDGLVCTICHLPSCWQ